MSDPDTIDSDAREERHVERLIAAGFRACHRCGKLVGEWHRHGRYDQRVYCDACACPDCRRETRLLRAETLRIQRRDRQPIPTESTVASDVDERIDR